MAGTFKFELVSPERVLLSDNAEQVVVPGSEGDFAVPFGGFKASGFGGKDKSLMAHDQYTEVKTIFYATEG